MISGSPVISDRRARTVVGVARVGVEAGADRGGAEVDLAQQRGGLGEPVLVLAEGDRVGAELLAQGHRHGVLQLGAADLEDVGELVGLGREGAPQLVHRREQPLGRPGAGRA